MQPVSIVIRARNERAHLAELLAAIERQDYSAPVEVVVVDSESTDGSPQLARKHGAKVVATLQAEFSFPRSMNAGVAAASHQLVVLTVAHALPVASDWLRAGLENFQDPQVGGVFSPVLARDDGSAAEKLFYRAGYEDAKRRGPYVAEAGQMGVFGATNCILRKSLWQMHHFDEAYGAGGEDGEWAAWAMKQGYTIICDYRFAVKHSHGLNAAQLKKQIVYWQQLGSPQPFKSEKIEAIKKGRFDGR